MIQDFFTTEFAVKRMTWLTDDEDNKYSSDTLIGTFLGHIQQANINLVQSLGLTFTKTYSVWCPVDTNVREGDKLETETETYSVRAVQKNNIGCNKHLELIIELDELVDMGS
jgi:hypothetical protein